MTYVSGFANDITGLIEQKRALGYKYGSEVGILKRFDTFCAENFANDTILNKEIVLAWAVIRPGEHPATLQSRVTPVNELARYLFRQGFPAFVLPKGMLPRVPKYTPYIYSNDELQRIFQQTDRCHYNVEVPYRHYVMPVFFRLLYACGLRLTEARLLKLQDVDFDEGVIMIINAKLDKHRQVPLSPQMLLRMQEYRQNVHMFSAPEAWLFPGYGGKPMTIGNVEKNLHKFLWQAGISRPGRSRVPGQTGGPRVHDFRHTQAVHCLRRWVLEGKDLRAYLPALQAYLGHVEFSDTAYYLHLTADLFPNITEQVQAAMGDVIPKVGSCHETD
jgi:integrase